ncbi:hypothetical protein MIN45_P1260 [Methylomarinovum tepidoasis]|uniref:AI-2E family transporter n=1 Tax=Methylomarinovum tepidoasis TaxID=2840183 RepID=A0AAU9C8Z5_9GAMM|nr:AI-2E family transporter [Methylomarinovum sp. IN45]BCX88890.1 hypothetical protein MIN45_P1260 [Methylomarinovum sp. IN45]
MNTDFNKIAIETAIRLGTITLLAAWCFLIVRPFVDVVIWGIVIAVSLHSPFRLLNRWLGDRQGWTALLLTVLMLTGLILPMIQLAEIAVRNFQSTAASLAGDMVSLPELPSRIADWPLIGRPLQRFWELLGHNLEDTFRLLRPQIRQLAGWLLSATAATGMAILQFVLAIIIAGLLLANAPAAARTARRIALRLAGERGPELVRLAESTIRGVATGVVGVALLQALLAGLGFVAVGLPGAGLLAVLCLFLAVIQLGPALVLVPAAIYVFSTQGGMVATAFTVWCVVVALLDNVLKPLLMGRGVDIPMLVIFLGAIGGMMLSGLIGLFVGAVVLALGYELFRGWVYLEA